MSKIRLSVCFDCTVEVPEDSTHDVALREAKSAIEAALPFRLDGEDWDDCEIQGVNSVNCEEM